MYHKKFDDVFIISPSHAKMGIKTKKDNTNAQFNLDWIFNKIEEINDDQINEVFGNHLAVSAKEKKNLQGKPMSDAYVNDSRSRFLIGDMFKTTPGAMSAATSINANKDKPQKKVDSREVFM